MGVFLNLCFSVPCLFFFWTLVSPLVFLFHCQSWRLIRPQCSVLGVRKAHPSLPISHPRKNTHEFDAVPACAAGRLRLPGQTCRFADAAGDPVGFFWTEFPLGLPTSWEAVSQGGREPPLPDEDQSGRLGAWQGWERFELHSCPWRGQPLRTAVERVAPAPSGSVLAPVQR